MFTNKWLRQITYKWLRHCVHLYAQQHHAWAQCDEQQEHHRAHGRAQHAVLSTLRAAHWCTLVSHRTCGSSPPRTRHPIHACAPVCCFLSVLFLVSCVLYLVSPFSFQPFLMFTSALNERSRSNPLCDFRLGTVVTSDYETPLTLRVRTWKRSSETCKGRSLTRRRIGVWLSLVRSDHWARIFRVAHDWSWSIGRCFQIVWLRWRRERRSISIHPTENGGRSRWIEIVKIRIFNHSDLKDIFRTSIGRITVAATIRNNCYSKTKGVNYLKENASLCTAKRSCVSLFMRTTKNGRKEENLKLSWRGLEKRRFWRIHSSTELGTIGMHTTRMQK